MSSIITEMIGEAIIFFWWIGTWNASDILINQYIPQEDHLKVNVLMAIVSMIIYYFYKTKLK